MDERLRDEVVQLELEEISERSVQCSQEAKKPRMKL